MWILEYTKKFSKQYKLLNSRLQEKVDLALSELAKSEDPTRCENTKSLEVYTYVLDKSNRILYNVSFNENTIELFRVGDHKKAYKGQ